MKNYLLFIIILVFCSCEKNDLIEPPLEEPPIIEPPIIEPPEEEFIPIYSFFVAGHTYGNPITFQFGFHPPFINQIPYLNNDPDLQFGVLTGDVVPIAMQEYWDSTLVDIDKFSVPIHIAAGNHDRGSIFEDLFPYYYSFWNEEDLFIILSPTDWNIAGDQKEFLLETINDGSSVAKNIFIFCHELIWWSPDNEFRNIKINFEPHYPGSTNYWSEISPFLESLPNNIVIFAGDLGAKADVTPYMYYKYENITLIGSGMGGGEEDNIIITEINREGELNFKLLGINSETPFELANLEEYELP